MNRDQRPLHARLRRQTRIEVDLFATLVCDGERLPALITELSLSGVRLACGRHLPYGSRGELLIQLDNRHHEVLPVRCAVRVVRHLDDGMGLAIERIEDPEGYDMLANLVLLHAADPARAARELARLPRPVRPGNDRHSSGRLRGSGSARLRL